jgi:ketose-bisphosphate aldolase
MSLECTLTDLLPLAERRNVCLPAFDIAVGQREFLRGVLGACEQLRCPALLLAWAMPTTLVDLEACVEVVRFHAARASVPVVLHLDHGKDESVLAKALDLGFHSVMFDGSTLPLEENIRRTKAMADLAHAHGATIEGEVGRIGIEMTDGVGAHALTDPEEAARFVAATGIDMFAPAVGNSHGFYKAPPKLRLDLIERIAARVGVPLSLHGGTGIPLDDVRKAAALGMRKMNVATDLHKSFADGLRAACADGAQAKFSWRKALESAGAAVCDTASRYIRGLGAEGLLT